MNGAPSMRGQLVPPAKTANDGVDVPWSEIAERRNRRSRRSRTSWSCGRNRGSTTTVTSSSAGASTRLRGHSSDSRSGCVRQKVSSRSSPTTSASPRAIATAPGRAARSKRTCPSTAASFVIAIGRTGTSGHCAWGTTPADYVRGLRERRRAVAASHCAGDRPAPRDVPRGARAGCLRARAAAERLDSRCVRRHLDPRRARSLMRSPRRLGCSDPGLHRVRRTRFTSSAASMAMTGAGDRGVVGSSDFGGGGAASTARRRR